MVEDEKNSCRFTYLGNAIFQPSQIKLVKMVFLNEFVLVGNSFYICIFLFASYNFEPLKVELHRQELHPYVVIILKSGKVSKIFII